MSVNKVFIGADHGGFELKEKAKAWLDEWGYEFEDCGAAELNPGDDYPRMAFEVAQKVSSSPASKGILFCRSGGGMVIAANKIDGIRAVSVANVPEVTHAREHNDANIISLAGDWVSEESAKAILKTFLTTESSSEERHQRRIAQIADFEKQHQA